MKEFIQFADQEEYSSTSSTELVSWFVEKKNDSWGLGPTAMINVFNIAVFL
jgi:hypothetical protein